MPDAAQRVLLVDDEQDVLDLASGSLARVGLACDTASNGQEAIRHLCRTKYDGVVTDIRMPHVHGHALCELLFRSQAPPPVMVLTGLADPGLTADLANRGIDEVVLKPIDFDVLAQKVLRMVVGAAQARLEAATSPSDMLREIESDLIESTGRVRERLGDLLDVDEDVPEPPPSMRGYIQRLAESEAKLPKKILPGHVDRAADRVSCCSPAIAAPVDRHWKPIDQPFRLVLRDLSSSGARFVHTRAISSEYLAVRWNATELSPNEIIAVVRLRRCAPIRCFYELGSQFLMMD